MKTKKNSKIIAIIGSRDMPKSFKNRIEFVIDVCEKAGCIFITGGAIGVELQALKTLILLDICRGSKIYLPSNIEFAPVSVKPWLEIFKKKGGEIVPGLNWGSNFGLKPNRQQYLEGIFTRNRIIAKEADVVISFPVEDAKGSWNVCNYAARLGKPIIVYVTKYTHLREYASGDWIKLERRWSGFSQLETKTEFILRRIKLC